MYVVDRRIMCTQLKDNMQAVEQLYNMYICQKGTCVHFQAGTLDNLWALKIAQIMVHHDGMCDDQLSQVCIEK